MSALLIQGTKIEYCNYPTMIILKKIKNLQLLTKQTSRIIFELMKNYHFLIKNTTFPIETNKVLLIQIKKTYTFV